MKKESGCKYITYIFLALFVATCTHEPEPEEFIPVRSFPVVESLVIGTAEQSNDQQLGQPVSVRTDSAGYIYIGDRAAVQIKVFDSNGDFKKNIGGRGRGPGEFIDLNMLDITDDSQLLITDRGKLEYIYLSTDGRFINSYPINISNQSVQYYPVSVRSDSEETIGLYLSGAVISEIPFFNRPFFHIYDTTFQDHKYSFGEFNKLEMNEMFPWFIMMWNPGSFTVSHNPIGVLLYSPGIYNGQLYVYSKNETGKWEYRRSASNNKEFPYPYIKLSETQYDAQSRNPGVLKAYFSGGPYIGRVNSIDAGVYILNNGRIVQFYLKWREKAENSGQSLIDLYMVLFSEEFEYLDESYILSFETALNTLFQSKPAVNWKDEKDNFYLLKEKDGYPVLLKFSVAIP